MACHEKRMSDQPIDLRATPQPYSDHMETPFQLQHASYRVSYWMPYKKNSRRIFMKLSGILRKELCVDTNPAWSDESNNLCDGTRI